MKIRHFQFWQNCIKTIEHEHGGLNSFNKDITTDLPQMNSNAYLMKIKKKAFSKTAPCPGEVETSPTWKNFADIIWHLIVYSRLVPNDLDFNGRVGHPRIIAGHALVDSRLWFPNIVDGVSGH